jgi:glycyl-tRNA synthetase (class II)
MRSAPIQTLLVTATDGHYDKAIYWFPAEEIYDGDTGAIDYVPLSS